MITEGIHIEALQKLPAFLEALQYSGIKFEVDTYHRIYTIINKGYPPPRLKTLLCPVIVNNDEDQALFYQIFDRFFPVDVPIIGSSHDPLVDPIVEDDLYLSEFPLSGNDQTKDSEKDSLPGQKEKDTNNNWLFGVSFLVFTGIIFLIVRYWRILTTQNKLGLIALCLLILALGIYIFFRLNRKFVARRIKAKEPPYFWNINLNREQRIDFGTDLPLVAQKFRHRLPDTTAQINIRSTIDKTIYNGGALSLQYVYRTRPAEYLFLIDQSAFEDHQHYLFELVHLELVKQNVYVERFFYKDDLQICWNERHKQGISLEKIAMDYPEYRLIIFGNAQKTLNPVNGVLLDWAQVFYHWQDRALLSPKPTSIWSYDELELSKLFVVLPSNLDGLQQVIEHFEQVKKSDLKAWRYEYNQPAVEPDPNNLHLHFTESLQTWIAACAIYPELIWDLTLYLGEVLSAHFNEHLLTFQNITKLAQLAWFRNGYIPDEHRETLLNFLNKELRMQLHQNLVNVLEQQLSRDLIPASSYAYSEFRLQLAVHKLESGQFEKERAKLKKEIKSLIQEGVNQDFIAIQSVRSARPLDVIVSPRLAGKAYFSEGIPTVVKNWEKRVLYFLIKLIRLLNTKAYKDWMVYIEGIRKATESLRAKNNIENVTIEEVLKDITLSSPPVLSQGYDYAFFITERGQWQIYFKKENCSHHPSSPQGMYAIRLMLMNPNKHIPFEEMHNHLKDAETKYAVKGHLSNSDPGLDKILERDIEELYRTYSKNWSLIKNKEIKFCTKDDLFSMQYFRSIVEAKIDHRPDSILFILRKEVTTKEQELSLALDIDENFSRPLNELKKDSMKTGNAKNRLETIRKSIYRAQEDFKDLAPPFYQYLKETIVVVKTNTPNEQYQPFTYVPKLAKDVHLHHIDWITDVTQEQGKFVKK